MSEPKPSLLPANSSPLEKALDLGFGRLLERIMPTFPALMNPLQTPSEFLPYLAADRGVSEWDADASETEKRLTVGLSWQIQRQAGTPKALSYAVESLGFRLTLTDVFVIWQPLTVAPNTQSVTGPCSVRQPNPRCCRPRRRLPVCTIPVPLCSAAPNSPRCGPIRVRARSCRRAGC